MKTLVAGVCLCLAPAFAGAQRLTGSIGGIGGAVRADGRVGTAADVATGAVIGVEGHAGIGRVTFDVSYLQGTLEPDVSGGLVRDYVEGDAFLSIVTFPGLILRGGPHARAFISDDGTQRWLFWTARARYEFRMITSPPIDGFAEGWAALSADVNVSEEFTSARGAIVGLNARFPGSAFYARLTYGMEQARMGGGNRIQNVEVMTFVLGFGRR